MIQRFIITGGPATGKSSIIEYFQQIGHPCFEEVSRGIIQEQNIQTSKKQNNTQSHKRHNKQSPQSHKVECISPHLYHSPHTTPQESME